MKEGAKDIALGEIVALGVYDKKDVAAFKDFKLDSAASAPAPAPAKKAAEPA